MKERARERMKEGKVLSVQKVHVSSWASHSTAIIIQSIQPRNHHDLSIRTRISAEVEVSRDNSCFPFLRWSPCYG